MFGELLWPATPEGHCVIGWLLLKTLMICWHIKVCFQLKNVPQQAKTAVLLHSFNSRSSASAGSSRLHIISANLTR